MGLLEAFKTWDEMGNTLSSHDGPNNEYITEFIDKSGQVVGNVIAYPGQGIRWNYPDELMNYYKSMKS